MKVKLNIGDQYPSNPRPYGLIRGKEYEVLGDLKFSVFLINEENKFSEIRVNELTVTDAEYPHFWKEDPLIPGRFTPEEWHHNQFEFLLDEFHVDFWGNYELWTLTQFVKGFKHYQLDQLPNQFKHAEDDAHKAYVINEYLKIITEIDSTDYVYWQYCFNKYWSSSNEPEILLWSNGEPVEHYDQIVTPNEGYDCLDKILTEMGPQHSSFKNDRIKNRILFTIWSIFSCKDFSITLRKFKSGHSETFILQKDEKRYALSEDQLT